MRPLSGALLGSAALLAVARVHAQADDASPDVTESIFSEAGAPQEDDGGDLVQSIGGEAEEQMVDSAASDDAEVVESIGGDDGWGDSLGDSDPGVVDEPEPERFTLSGWFLESLEWSFYQGGVGRDDDDDVFAVPRDQAVSRTQLLIRSNYQRGRSFEATASGLLHLGLHADTDLGELDESGASKGKVWVLPEAQLRELSVGFFFDDFDLRLGQQRLAWGRTDILSPNDIINARDMRNPFLGDPELRYKPTPLARLDLYLGALSLQGVFAPVFIPDEAVLYGTNWAAVQPSTPERYRGMFNLINRAFDPSLQEQINGVLQQTRLPNRNAEGMAGGVRLGLRLDGLDVAAYYHYGFDGLPYLFIDPAFDVLLDNIDFETAGLADFAPVLMAIDAGLSPIVAEYVRRHHVGVDAETTLGPFVFRLDAAFQSQRVFYRLDLTSVSIPTALGVFAIEYQTGDIAKTLIVELVYIRLLEDPSEALLIYNRDSYGLGYLLRFPLLDSLGLEVRGTAGISPTFYTVQPSLTLAVGEVDLSVGAVVLGGDPRSLGGYYTDNDTAFLQVHHAF